MSNIDNKIKELSMKISGQMDAHLIESIISLFNRGVLKHYVRSPRTSFDSNNLKMSINAASGVEFEGRERMIELEQQLAEANELLKKANNYGGCEFREINEYFEKYKD